MLGSAQFNSAGLSSAQLSSDERQQQQRVTGKTNLYEKVLSGGLSLWAGGSVSLAQPLLRQLAGSELYSTQRSLQSVVVEISLD